jgi:hypothetical protein
MRRRLSIAAGTKIPLIYACHEVNAGEPKKPVRAEVILNSEGITGLRLDEDDVLHVDGPGTGVIWLETPDGSVASNRIDIEVVACSDVEVVVPVELLMQGQRLKLPISFRTISGGRDDILIDASIDEPAMAWIGRAGYLTTGLHEGTATLRIRFGPGRSDQKPFVFRIGTERAPVKGSGGEKGGNIPEILLCGEQAPGMEAYPKEQRTHMGGEHFPTIIEEPQFANIVWINHTSKEASRVRASRGGPSGIASIGTKTFVQFVALKCFEILKRLKVRQDIGEQMINETQFVQLIAQAEMDCASFVDAAYEVSETLVSSEVD